MAHDVAVPLTNQSSAMDRSWGAVPASTIGLIFSLGTLLVYPFGVFIQPLTHEFGWTRTQIAGALSISQLSFAFTAPVWGMLLDRFGPRAVLLPSIVCISALVASLGLLTPHVWHFYLVFLAISFFAGGASPLGYSAVLARKFDRHLGLALGLALMGVGIGAALLPPLSQLLISDFGWRSAYAALGGLTLVITIPAAFVATSGMPQLRKTRSATETAVLPLIGSWAFLLLCALFLLLGIVTVGTLAHLVPIMIGRGFSPQGAAQVAGVTGLATIAGRGGIGWLLDRLYPPRVVAGVALLAVGSFLLLAYGSGTGLAYLAAAMLGGVVGAEVDFTAFFVRRYFGNAVFGRLYGVAFGVFMFGSGIGPLLLSKAADRFGNYQAGELLFAGLSAAVALLTFFLPTMSHSIEHAAA